MARLFGTGFEHGSMGVFTAVSGTVGATFGANATNPRTGERAFEFRANNAYGSISLDAARAELYFRLGFRGTGGGAGTNRRFMQMFDSAGGGQFNLAVNSTTRQLEVRRGGAVNNAGTLLASGGELPLDEYRCIELHLLVADSGGIAQVKIDGVLVIDFEGDTKQTANADVLTICYGAVGSDAITQGYIDDIAINDTTGLYNNSWPGRGGFHAAVPSGAGEYTEFTPSSGNNYERVAVIPPDDDTGYVESGTAGHRDLYTTGGIVPVDGTISAVHWWSRAKLADSGVGNIQRLVRHNGVDYASADKAIDLTYRDVGDIMELAPDGTGWTVAKVNALQIGQKVS